MEMGNGGVIRNAATPLGARYARRVTVHCWLTDDELRDFAAAFPIQRPHEHDGELADLVALCLETSVRDSIEMGQHQSAAHRGSRA